MLGYCQLDNYNQISAKFLSNNKHFHLRKCMWKHRLWNGGHFAGGLVKSAIQCFTCLLMYEFIMVHPSLVGLYLKLMTGHNKWEDGTVHHQVMFMCSTLLRRHSQRLYYNDLYKRSIQMKHDITLTHNCINQICGPLHTNSCVKQIKAHLPIVIFRNYIRNFVHYVNYSIYTIRCYLWSL